jgi:surface polysaccharide O-acyltransferase-like enzyme
MERNYAFDYLKFFAICAVILIHTGPFEEVTLLGLDGYYIDFTIDTLSRFAVPFFFMASGYLFTKKMSTGDQNGVYFSRYISKLCKLFASWFIFYMIYEWFSNLIVTRDLTSLPETLGYIRENIRLEVFIYGASPGYQLWYLVALIWSIAILYIFIHLKKLNLLLLISLGLNVAGLFGQSYSGLISLPFDTRDAIFFGLLYTVLGAYAARNEHEVKTRIAGINHRIWLSLSIVFSILALIERGVTVFLLDGKIGDYFLLSIPVTITLFLYALANPGLGKDSAIAKIGKKSVGIYVIHVFFIKSIHLGTDLAGYSFMKEKIIWHILFSPLVLILSYITYELLQKFKKQVVQPMIGVKRMPMAEWKQ